MIWAIRINIPLPEFVFRLCVWTAVHYRKLRYGYAFRRIPLTQGKFAIVDTDRYDKLAKHKWFAVRGKRGYYAVRAIKSKKDKIEHNIARMHRVLLNPQEDKIVDHINHNSLDNRRANLRVCTIQQNVWNKRKQRGNYTSKYKGVSFSKTSNKWRVRIMYNAKSIALGYFDNETKAARAYDAKARQLFGEYASLNFK